jgi:transcription elongation factor Elf1
MNISLQLQCPYCFTVNFASIKEQELKISPKHYGLDCTSCTADFQVELRRDINIHISKTIQFPLSQKKLAHKRKR